MRKILLLALLLPVLSIAQVPQAFDFQGVARDASGEPLVSQSITLRLSIISGTPSGTMVYQEDQAATTTPFGLFNVRIGDGTPVVGSFPAIDWASASHFLKVEYDPDGGNAYVHMGTTQLLSVPYALVSGSSTNCFSVSFSGDTLYQGNGCWVIIPGISGANGGCLDADGDGYFAQTGCGTPLDCNDNDPNTFPGANEVCDGADNNCDGTVDEGNVCINCADGIKNGSETDVDCGGVDCPPCAQGQGCATMNDCGPGLICQGGICVPNCPDLDQDGWTTCDGDCDDTNPAVHPGAAEQCNGMDDDCDGQVDEWGVCPSCTDGIKNGNETGVDCGGSCPPCGQGQLCMIDQDCGPGLICQGGICVPNCPDLDQDGWTTCDGDCDDTNPAVHPGAAEQCNGMDDDCDGQVDEWGVCPSCTDGIKNGNETGVDCGGSCPPCGQGQLCMIDQDCGPGLICQSGICVANCPDLDQDGWTTCDGDCNDFDPSVNPGAIEQCNGVDDDCDTGVDEDWNFSSDPQNCGGCGLLCPPAPNSTPQCVNGSCTLVCNIGFADCDGSMANGCETNLNTSSNNCGACGVQCPVGMVCQNGTCVPMPCAITGDCPPNFYCSNGQCMPKKQSGAACSSGDECLSGTCLFGQCQ